MSQQDRQRRREKERQKQEDAYAYYKNKIKRKIKENIPTVGKTIVGTPELLHCAAADASKALAAVLDGGRIVGGIGPQPQHFARAYWAHFGYERELGKLSRKAAQREEEEEETGEKGTAAMGAEEQQSRRRRR